jgi:TRAP-type C4-dicarboxylate transport system permease small subunit
MSASPSASASVSRRFQILVAWLFGLCLCLLSLTVAAEVLMRKFFLISLQGVDELSGYALAVTAALGFFLALGEGGHMRIDILYARLSARLRLLSDGLAVIAMAGAAVLIFWMGWITLSESREFNSVAQTPWATPMVIPQSIWLVAMLPFLAAALYGFLRWLWALLKADRRILAEFRAKGSGDEVQEQLQALSERGGVPPTHVKGP